MAAVDFTIAEGTIIGPLDLEPQLLVDLRRFFQINARNPDSVDDLMQDMFEALLRYKAPAQLLDQRAYFFQVAWNVLNGANRRTRRETRLVPIDTRVVDRHVASEDDTSASLIEARWTAIFAKLPARCQVVVQRHFGDRQTCQQVAAELGCSIAVVKKDACKALNSFRQHFTGADDTQQRRPRGSNRGEES